jgi:hypothetical protein
MKPIASEPATDRVPVAGGAICPRCAALMSQFITDDIVRCLTPPTDRKIAILPTCPAAPALALVVLGFASRPARRCWAASPLQHARRAAVLPSGRQNNWQGGFSGARVGHASWRGVYNIDALWVRIAIELDEAKLVQLNRLLVGQQGLSLRELADQLGQASRTSVIIGGGRPSTVAMRPSHSQQLYRSDFDERFQLTTAKPFA